jgi:citrate synthase
MTNNTVYHSAIWQELAEQDNPFAIRTAYCHGYNVYEDILAKSTWIEALWLMFMGDKPTTQQKLLLEKLAILLMFTSMRDASNRAAMNSGVSGATHAASLMAALAIGSGQYGGAREVYLLVQRWQKTGLNIQLFLTELLEDTLEDVKSAEADIWHPIEHPLGFDVHTPSCPTSLCQALDTLLEIKQDGALNLLKKHQYELQKKLSGSLSLTGVVAAAFYDLGLSPSQAEMLFLMLRLPSSAVFALEQKQLGWRNFPFFGHQIHLDK